MLAWHLVPMIATTLGKPASKSMPPALSSPNLSFLFVCLMVLVLPCSLGGQQYRLDSYGQAEGLKDGQIQDIAFDRDGFLWVASGSGLYRFLGTHFEYYGREQGLTDRNVIEVYVDPQDRVWAATPFQLFLLRGNRFSPVGVAPIRTLRPGHSLLALARDRLLVISDGQLQELTLDATAGSVSSAPVFSSEQRKTHPELNAINTLATEKDGRLWLACGVHICSVDKGKLQTWGSNQGVEASNWLTLYVDSRRSLWAVSKTKALELPAGSTRFRDRSPPSVSDGFFFYWSPIVEDRLGRILVDSAKGLARWNGSSWQFFGVKNGLTNSRITSLAIDARGDPWMGSIGAGVFRWPGYEHWEGWTDADGLPSSIIWSLNSDGRNQVLVGTKDGAAIFDIQARVIKSLVTASSWSYGQVGGIARDRRGRIWATTFSGWVLCIDQKSYLIKPIANLATYVPGLFVSPDGRFWILSSNGLWVVNEPETSPTVRHVSEPDDLYPGKGPFRVAAMAAAKAVDGDIWMLAKQGVLRYHNRVWSRPAIYGLNAEEVIFKEISEASDGSLWVAGEETQQAAIWHMIPDKAGLYASRLQLPDYLRAGVLNSMMIDRRGWLWVGTNGVAGWNGSTWRLFNQETGLISNATDRGVMCEAQDGSILVGTSGGLGRIVHPETAFDPDGQSTFITEIQRGRRSYRADDNPTLPWVSGNLLFRFASPNTGNRHSLSFSYRILGLDSSWSSTQDTQASFISLPPGRFRFQVYAENKDLGTTSKAVEASFEILPPWWRTSWFYCLCGLAGIVLIWLLIQFRTRVLLSNAQALQRVIEEMSIETNRLAKIEQQSALVEQRNLLAHELHDELAGAFTGIFMQLQAASQLADSAAGTSRECVGRAETLARDGLRRLREFVQLLTDKPAYRPPALQVMRQLITQATAGTATTGRFVVEGSESPIKLGHAHAIELIIKEAVGNAQRYAEARNISVTLRFDVDSLVLLICDDGKGFRVDELSEIGFGINSMKARTNRLAGQFCIESSLGGGTGISVTLPHPYQGDSRVQ